MANSLVELRLKHYRTHNFKNLIGPFNKVKKIYFENCSTEHITNLPYIFPAVRRFIFNTTPNQFNHHFPHLIEVENRMEDNAHELETLILLNPQIKKLTLQTLYWDLMQTINFTLTQLEHLEIQTLFVRARGSPGGPVEQEHLYLEHLKTFRLWFVRDLADNSEFPIKFGNHLEEIIDWTPKNILLDLMLQTKGLKKVGIQGLRYY